MPLPPKAPLSFNDSPEDEGRYIEDADGFYVAFVPYDQTLIEDNSAENARRLAACWNALQHVSTEQLESGEVHSLAQSMVNAERQRDLLLFALESIVLHADPKLFSAGQLERAKTAIAAAKVGAK